MAKIAPSILSADFANLESAIHDIERNGADWVHVDVMDGIFVPNITIGIPVVKALRPVTDLPLDVHLMIDRPIRYVEDFVKAGADFVTIHVEADQPQNTLEALDKIHAMGTAPLPQETTNSIPRPGIFPPAPKRITTIPSSSATVRGSQATSP